MDFTTAFSVVQTLLIFQAPSFLSDDSADRLAGLTFLTYIVQIARQAGLFKPGADWVELVVVEGWDALPLSEDQVLEDRWKEWIRRETIRRCVALLYARDDMSMTVTAV